MSDFYNLLGGFYWWLLVKFCQTKLKEEQAQVNKIRNLIFVFLMNILLIITIVLFFIYF
jgi:hypothetical protein